MFKLTMFPAGDGDCIMLSYADKDKTPLHVLVDGGRASCFDRIRPRLLEIRKAGQRIELLVLSHIDADHISGLLKLVADEEVWEMIDQVWFNGFDQISMDIQPLSFPQADAYSKALHDRGVDLNRDFGGRAVALRSDGSPFVVTLPSGLELTIVSPGRPELQKLHDIWSKARMDIAAATDKEPDTILQALGPEEFIDVERLAASQPNKLDDAEENGSSIAFLAQWQDAVVLLAADAHAPVLEASLKRLDPDGVTVDLFKVAHHGSSSNTTESMLRALRCSRFAISTNGPRKHGHPNRDSVAKFIKAGQRAVADGEQIELFFNYRQEFAGVWENDELIKKYDYAPKFPEPEQNGTIIIPVKRV